MSVSISSCDLSKHQIIDDPNKSSSLRQGAGHLSLNVKTISSPLRDIPFKANQSTIVIMKDLPVYQCENCSEHLLDDPVLKRVEKIIKNVDSAAELEVIKYAA
jgi:YgiT-type zinc finger domain-containing protein